MDINKKAKLICDFSAKYRNNEDLSEFFQTHNMGVPLSYALEIGMITGLTGIGEVLIEDTYEDMVTNVFANDPSVDYDSIEQMIRVIDPEDIGL